MSIELNKLTHEYRKDGTLYDPVTQVCSSVLHTESPWWKVDHQLRGTFVHSITEAVDDGEWDPRLTVFPDSLGWGDAAKDKIIQRGFAYQRFMDETGFKAIKKEFIVYSDVLQIAGTIDKFGIFTKGRYAGWKAIVDIKSGEPTPSAIIQVALYEILLDECQPEQRGEPKLRVILHLREDGTCRPEYRHANNGYNDRMEAISIVNTYRFMKRHKLL